jgi:heme-degrading monooxygenase HmoA
MIARTWRGATRAADAEAYVEYLGKTGNLGPLALRRPAGDRAELLLVTPWDSMAAVKRFAGDDPERAVFYPGDDRYLVARDLHVDHYEVVSSSLVDGPR